MIFVTVVTLLQEKSGFPLLLPRNGLWGGISRGGNRAFAVTESFPGKKACVFFEILDAENLPGLCYAICVQAFFRHCIDLFPYFKE